MEKCYLFGGGMNCYGVIKFIGKENIIAVIDNNEKKQGHEIEGIRIISFAEFLRTYQREVVVISAYYARNEVKQMLLENEITNYVAAPYMQKGYFESYRELISYYNLNIIDNLYIYGENIFSKEICALLSTMNRQKSIAGFIKDGNFQDGKFQDFPVLELNQVPIGANILLATDLDDGEYAAVRNVNKKFKITDMYQQTIKYNRQLQKFKNIWEGKRCFIIGNGPSLRIKDLDVLHRDGEICFGSNWIIKMFDKTDWRPDYYVVMDYNMIRNMAQNMDLTGEITTFIADSYTEETALNKEYIYTYQSILYNEKEINFSGNIVEGIYSGKTVTYDMIQIAAYMGFKEIYLLGVDCTDGSNHFYSDNTIDKTRLENLTVTTENNWNKVYGIWIKNYQKAEEYSRNNNFRIFNATRGGALEVFERVNFDELF